METIDSHTSEVEKLTNLNLGTLVSCNILGWEGVAKDPITS